ncbi:unnamed protein product [Polarella glacialis]|uniref:Uncharacterized protein n=1 Tax=Polarella glacialis TaxID=89957 RepID=A0A813KYX9_POLGL|nr:unnamed protein product [Polarella glacialis]
MSRGALSSGRCHWCLLFGFVSFAVVVVVLVVVVVVAVVVFVMIVVAVVIVVFCSYCPLLFVVLHCYMYSLPSQHLSKAILSKARFCGSRSKPAKEVQKPGCFGAIRSFNGY